MQDGYPPVAQGAQGFVVLVVGGAAFVVGVATLLQQRAMVSFDWVGASAIAAIMTVITITIVLAMSHIARRINPMAT